MKCTKVNRTWEGEARTHILARNSVQLQVRNFKKYFKTMRLRRSYHKNIYIYLHCMTPHEISNYLEKLAPRLSRNWEKVTRLKIDFPMDLPSDSISIPIRILETLKIMKNVKSLEIRPIFRKLWNELNVHKLKEHLAQNSRAFRHVTKFGIWLTDVADYDEDHREPNMQDLLEPLIPHFFPLFPNLKILKLTDTPGFDMFQLPRKLNKLIIRRTDRTSINLMTPCLPLKPVTLTRLEVTMQDACPYIVTQLAPHLEHLCIHAELSVDSSFDDPWIFPVMPKLKVLEFWISPELYSIWGSMCVNLNFKYAIVDKSTGEKLIYAQQFPLLESLTVRMEPEKSSEKVVCALPGRMFDVVYRHFIPRNTAPCKTLKYLDIPFPTEDKFRVSIWWKCSGTKRCHCCEWMYAWEYFDVVARTFPNFDSPLVEEGRKNRLMD